jgi:exodeoxyribonuclease-3
MGSRLRLASVNVNGIRAAYRKGMGEWLADRDVDVLTLQEVRASTDDLEGLLGPEWNVLHHPATAKGRAGVAIASRGAARIHRVELGPDDFDSAGRWPTTTSTARSSRSSAPTCTRARSAPRSRTRSGSSSTR